VTPFLDVSLQPGYGAKEDEFYKKFDNNPKANAIYQFGGLAR
jgi:hypothetical protein